MRFPLPTQPFPTVVLPHRDAHTLECVTDDIAAGTLAYYEEHLKYDRGIVDENYWKFIKRRENMAVYHEREAHMASKAIPDGNGSGIRNSDVSEKVQKLLAVGTIDGDLDDLMYGVVNPTTENMMIKTSYIHDNVVDCCVLSTLISPTPEDPLRSLILKWSINGAPAIVRPVIWARDFTYIESTGIMENSDGERVGYHIIHSVDVEGVRRLPEHKLVRGSLHLYHIYRQQRPNVVEVYVRGYCLLAGGMHPTVAMYSCADATIAIWRTMMCSQMKKLTWMLQKNQNLVYEGDPNWCAVCRRTLCGLLNGSKCCRVCHGHICPRCSERKRLSFLSSTTRDVITKRLTFCTRCIRSSIFANGRIVAQEELSRDNHFEAFENIPVMSPFSSTTKSSFF
ncbi:hypothetical protein BBJ28_00014612 [Nothophytophthora sp. Chile5]|nr:hypothetical protein BBJ28_00014612 [Nothophytophthora sp. Chile5]